MSLVMRERSFEEIAAAVVAVDDRRTHDRLKLMKTMSISLVESSSASQTATAVDISRKGLYFTVRSGVYQDGMDLKVTIPSLGFEGIIRVVRIEELPGGYVGVGCQVLGW
jgi:hypothetical protein